MRTYLIILGQIEGSDSDQKFADFVNRNKFDYWRYTTFNWILLTPDTVSTNFLIAEVTKAYGPVFSCVLEISINDIGGIFPISEKEKIELKGWSPFMWFNQIKAPDFVPRWIKEENS